MKWSCLVHRFTHRRPSCPRPRLGGSGGRRCWLPTLKSEGPEALHPADDTSAATAYFRGGFSGGFGGLKAGTPGPLGPRNFNPDLRFNRENSEQVADLLGCVVLDTGTLHSQPWNAESVDNLPKWLGWTFSRRGSASLTGCVPMRQGLGVRIYRICRRATK